MILANITSLIAYGMFMWIFGILTGLFFKMKYLRNFWGVRGVK